MEIGALQKPWEQSAPARVTAQNTKDPKGKRSETRARRKRIESASTVGSRDTLRQLCNPPQNTMKSHRSRTFRMSLPLSSISSPVISTGTSVHFSVQDPALWAAEAAQPQRKLRQRDARGSLVPTTHEDHFATDDEYGGRSSIAESSRDSHSVEYAA